LGENRQKLVKNLKYMNVSSVSSATNPYQASSTDGFNQLFSDFKGIGSSIQSGNLTSAQTALTSFENDLQSSTGTNPLTKLFSNNSTLSTDLTNLQNALKSNDPSGAQSAFKTLTQDMQTAMKTQGTKRHHHHHHADNDASSSSTSSNSTNSTASSSSTGIGLNVQA
jgi:hypothetical protein